jgi:hypothetical protein
MVAEVGRAMINDLSQLLKKILDDPQLPEPLRSARIAFERPTDPYNPGQRTVNVFLYDIRENTELRSNEPVIERRNGRAFIRRAPLRVSCSYLITAWPDGIAGEAMVMQEHQLLSQVLQTLSRFPTIPASILAGTNLADQEPLLPLMTAQADGIKSASEFWSSLGNKIRPSITVTVTISMAVFDDVTGPLVTTIGTEFAPGVAAPPDAFVQVGGQVLSNVGQTIADALVDITDAGLRTRTNAEGFYSFSSVPPGMHTISVVAVGFNPQTQPLIVPSQPEDYVITLTPLP